jgi:hypothetical protein
MSVKSLSATILWLLTPLKAGHSAAPTTAPADDAPAPRSKETAMSIGIAIGSLLSVSLMSLQLFGAKPATTQPKIAESPLTTRLDFLGNQLAADEAAIAAINKALVLAGYKAAVATEKAAGAAKGNELMDRKGGAPVPWQDFYGRTAKNFVLHDKYSPVYHQQQRPTQFDYVYHANNQQIEAARASVAAMEKKTDALLKRRRELEAEESALWATIALESVQNRAIPEQRLYRNQLRIRGAALDDNQPELQQIKAMRAAVLYVRAVDQVCTTLAERLKSNQLETYQTLRDTLQQAGRALQESALSFADGPGVNPADARLMSDVAALAKELQTHCAQLCDAFQTALDADGANEDGRKQTARGALQESLFRFAEAAARLDESASKLAEKWSIEGEQGKVAAYQPIVAKQSTSANAPQPEAVKAGRPAVDLLKLFSPAGVLRGNWMMKDGELFGATQEPGNAGMRFQYQPPEEYDYRIDFVRISGNDSVGQTAAIGEKRFRWYIGRKGNTESALWPIDGKGLRDDDANPSAVKREAWLVNGQRYTSVIEVRKNEIRCRLNGRVVMKWPMDPPRLGRPPERPDGGAVGVLVLEGSIRVERAEIIEISGPGKVLPAKGS